MWEALFLLSQLASLRWILTSIYTLDIDFLLPSVTSGSCIQVSNGSFDIANLTFTIDYDGLSALQAIFARDCFWNTQHQDQDDNPWDVLSLPGTLNVKANTDAKILCWTLEAPVLPFPSTTPLGMVWYHRYHTLP
eukprot:scaffold778_cov126-Amphora_coffeaeformis.AAC.1